MITLYTEDWLTPGKFNAETFDRVTPQFAIKGTKRVALQNWHHWYFPTMQEAVENARKRRERQVEAGHRALEQARRDIEIAQAVLDRFNAQYPQGGQSE